MGRAIRVVLVTVALVVGLLVPASAAQPGHVDVIVVLDDGRPARADAADMSRRYDAQVEHVYEHVFAGFSASVPEGRLGALSRDARVTRVDEDRPVHATETVPTGVQRIGAPTAHGVETGADLQVGILDTGIRDHGDLNIAWSAGTNCTSTTTTDTDDVHGHGTHVAGTVGAVDNSRDVLGVAPAVAVVPIKVLDDGGSGSWSTVACGLNHAAMYGIPVVNLSLSGGVTSSDTVKPCGDTAGDSLYLAVCGAIAKGVTVVAAAGNDGHDARNNLPAAYPDVITVSALEDHNGTADTGGACSGRGPWKTCEDVLASFSNYGPAIDVIAPGVSILSTTNDGKTGSKSGTSMAAPHVAGVAALIIGQHGGIGHHAVRDHLLASGQCPDTTQAAAGACDGQSWPHDPDSVAEPLVNAAWAVSQTPGSGGGGDGGEETVENSAPTASFEPTCTDLSCSFTDTSTDGDGTVVGWAWNFGDGTTSTAQHPTHTYAAADTYTVTLVVTDNDGATSTAASATVTVTEPSEPSPGTHDWNLVVTGDKVKGEKSASLTWAPSSASTVDVLVDGAVVEAATPNDGEWGPYGGLGKGGGTHTFQVCETGGDAPACSTIESLSF